MNEYFWNVWSKVKQIFGIFGVILLVILALTLLFVALYVIITPLNMVECSRFGVNTGFPTHYDFWAGQCFAQYKGIWLPIDQIFQLIGK